MPTGDSLMIEAEVALHAARATWWSQIVTDAEHYHRQLAHGLAATEPAVEKVFCAMLEAPLAELADHVDVAIDLFGLLHAHARSALQRCHGNDIRRAEFWQGVAARCTRSSRPPSVVRG
jgi:hypothetical protein